MSADSELVNDSLMEFIEEYFRGDVSDFTFSQGISDEKEPDIEDCDDDDEEFEECGMLVDDADKDVEPNLTRAFDDSVTSESEANTSSEVFSSAENSVLLNSSIVAAPASTNHDLSINSPAELERSLRRKSISYEIRFTNLKQEKGKVKVHIVPNQNQGNSLYLSEPAKSPVGKVLSPEEKLRLENSSLRKTVQILEKKLFSLEKESEKVVGELKKIIERKNEIISKLELQIAGINFMDQSTTATS